MKQLYVLLMFGCMCGALKCPAVNQTSIVTLPSLDPVQYSYAIQISVPDQQLTYDAFEFYDHDNDTISLYVDTTDGSQEVRKQIVYDYQYNQSFVVKRTNTSSECVVKNLDTSLPHQLTLFGVGVENGPSSVKYAFYWNGSYNFTHEGVETVYGIATDHYKTCIGFENGNLIYLVDVYFSVANWAMPAGQRIPVLLNLTATYSNGTSRFYYFRFSNYHTSKTRPAWRPHKPSDMVCHGRNDTPQFSLSNHSQHVMNTQSSGTVNNFNFLTNVVHAMDYTSLLYMLNIKVLPYFEVTWIYDFREGLSYNINHTTGQCKVTPIPQNTSLVAVNNHSQVQMRNYDNPMKLFNLTFGGVTLYKNVLCNLWIAQKPIAAYDDIHHIKNGSWYIDYYISVAKYNGKNRLMAMRDRIVSQVNGTTTNSILYTDVCGEEYKVNSKMFDTSSCFNHSMKETYVLKFPSDPLQDIYDNPKGFQNSLISSVASNSNLREVRVQYSGMVVDTKQAAIYVKVTLLGVPNIQGDSVEMVPQISLKSAVNFLKSAVTASALAVAFNTSDAKVVSMTASSDFFNTESFLYRPPGMGVGQIAGLAVGMVVVGLLVGFLMAYFKFGRKNSQFAYGMQE